MTNTKIILFDGVCNLCNGFVNKIIANDPDSIFNFVSLQSELGKELIQKHNISLQIDSVILIESKAVYIKSKAAIRILKVLKMYSFITFFDFLPLAIKDKIYDFVAKNRYSWFGKSETCLIPNENLKSRFLS